MSGIVESIYIEIEVSGSGQRLVEPTTLDGISTSLSSNRSSAEEAPFEDFPLKHQCNSAILQ